MTDDQITRRKFVKDATAAAAGIAVGMSAVILLRSRPKQMTKRQ